MMAPQTLYGEALRDGGPLVARDSSGMPRPLQLTRWTSPACDVDERVLAHARGPVLDVGCGPGRHVRALRARGVEVLGIDPSGVAVRMARRTGATPVLRGDIFAPLPRAGWWNSAILLDGNLGIGGDPAVLLRRVRAVLAPGGRIVCETEPPGGGVRTDPVRLETDIHHSAWFAWARVASDALDPLTEQAGLAVVERWHDSDRWFAVLA